MTFLLTLVALTLSPAPARADAGNPFDPDRQRPRSCDQGAVAACQSDNHHAADGARASAAAFQVKIDALSQDIARVNDDMAARSAKIKVMGDEIALATSEISFLQLVPPPPAEEIFPDFPSPEDFFRLQPLDREWFDRFRTERGQRLSDRVDQATAERKSETFQLITIQLNFATLEGQLNLLQYSRNNALAAASSHDSMCSSGCLQQFCPAWHP